MSRQIRSTLERDGPVPNLVIHHVIMMMMLMMLMMHRLSLKITSSHIVLNSFEAHFCLVRRRYHVMMSMMMMMMNAWQVWPRSGETTCRGRSVVDYLLAPVSRARYLLKDLCIVPLEKKSDHNAITFSLRRPHPVAIDFSSIIKNSKVISDVADVVEAAEIKAVMRAVTLSSTASSDKEEIKQPDESCRKLPHAQKEEVSSQRIRIISKKPQSIVAPGTAKMSNNGMGMVQSHHHHQKSSTESKKNHGVKGAGVNLKKRDESNLLSSLMSAIVSGGEWEPASGIRMTVSGTDGHGEGFRYAVRSMAEREGVDHSSKWNSDASDKVKKQ